MLSVVNHFERVKIKRDPEVSSFPQLSRRLTLTCGAEGIPEPNITWYKDNVPLEGELSKTLILTEVELEDRGRYRCSASNFNPNMAQSETNKFEDNSEDAVVNIQGN